MCREMAELGMDIARLAAQAAREEWASPPVPRPQSQAAKPPQARRTPRQPGLAEPRERPASPTLAFTRLTHAIRAIIALEARLAAAARQADEQAARHANDRAYLQALQATPKPTQPSPAPAPPRKAAPDANPVPSLLATLSRDLGIDLEDPTLPDRVAAFFPPTGPPA